MGAKSKQIKKKYHYCYPDKNQREYCAGYCALNNSFNGAFERAKNINIHKLILTAYTQKEKKKSKQEKFSYSFTNKQRDYKTQKRNKNNNLFHIGIIP